MQAPEIHLERRQSGGGPFARISSRDLLGRSYVLLAASEGEAWCQAAEAVRAKLAGVSFDIHRVGSKELRDPEGRFAIDYGVGFAGAVLVRPDGSIAWRADSLLGDPERVLIDAFSRLAGMKPAASPKPALAVVKTPPPAPAPAAAPAVYPTGGFHNPFARPMPSFDGVKLYMHPVSMTSRPVRLFLAESGIKLDEHVVDLAKGAHHDPEFTKKNPTQQVPMLEDGDFRLTESSAILKYLADRIVSPAYPSDPKRRAKIDEMMDWLNTQFYRDWAYNLCFPQLFPHHRRRSEEAHAGAVEWGRENSRRWLQVLNDHWIGDRQFLVGNRITLADYFGSGLVTLGEAIHTDFEKYPNVARWLGNMKALKHWGPVNEVFDRFVGTTKSEPFETV